MLAAVSNIIRHTTFKCEWSWVIEFFPLQKEKYASSCWVSNHFVKLAFKCCLNWVFDVNNSDWDFIRFRYLLKSPLFYLTHIWTLYSTVKLSSVTVSWLLFVIKKIYAKLLRRIWLKDLLVVSSMFIGSSSKLLLAKVFHSSSACVTVLVHTFSYATQPDQFTHTFCWP